MVKLISEVLKIAPPLPFHLYIYRTRGYTARYRKVGFYTIPATYTYSIHRPCFRSEQITSDIGKTVTPHLLRRAHTSRVPLNAVIRGSGTPRHALDYAKTTDGTV